VKYNVKKGQNKSIRVANYATDPLPIRLTSEAWDKRLYMPEGYEPLPDPSWITIKPAEQTIEGEQIGSFNVEINIPDNAKHRGKKYAALIRSGLTTGFWLDAPVRLYITTNP
jgi:hypothetical protein